MDLTYSFFTEVETEEQEGCGGSDGVTPSSSTLEGGCCWMEGGIEGWETDQEECETEEYPGCR